MVRSLQIAFAARSEQDFDVLTKLLNALGLGKSSRQQRNSELAIEFRPHNLRLSLAYSRRDKLHPDLVVSLDDPESALEVIRRMKIEVRDSDSGDVAEIAHRSFTVHLPHGTHVHLVPSTSKNLGQYEVVGNLSAEGQRLAIVVSRFNSFITDRLLAGTLDALVRCGVEHEKDVDIIRVPGAFEIPSAARTLAQTKKYDAIICIGCLLRGDTAHYDVIANEVTRGIGQSAQDTGVPHAFGVLTCDTLEQAIDRAGLKAGNKGFEAALAAVEMASLNKAISSQPSALNTKKSKSKRAPRPATRAKPTARKR